ncbi:hypothetical protein SAMN02745116_01112 [Pilibacter termitis]|uniref:Bacteriocin (Lactococcin_972) n=1 Tax=Pilibacter termitis TaxID=263852 RepID=A0A1T4MJ12_9ENTE|nr:hypothetical protein [Pilibacter termitis]SJZ66913.1 hypothetical protein SAMN02745116_01112 [Pilibacter termitis]
MNVQKLTKKSILTTVAVATFGVALSQTASATISNPHPWLIDEWDHSSTSGSTNAYSNYYVKDSRRYGSIAYCINGLGVTRKYEKKDYGKAYTSHKKDGWDMASKIYPGWNVYGF